MGLLIPIAQEFVLTKFISSDKLPSASLNPNKLKEILLDKV
jgi:hypothetical protein